MLPRGASRIAVALRLTRRSAPQSRELGQHRGVRPHAHLEAAQLELLVRRVHPVVLQAEADEQRVEPEDSLHRADGGDRAAAADEHGLAVEGGGQDRKSTRLNSSHANISYA